MSLLLYVAVLLVSLSSVLFGLGWLSTPEPHYPATAAQVANRASPPKTDGRATLTPVYPAAPGASVADSSKAVASKPASSPSPEAAPPQQTVAATTASSDTAASNTQSTQTADPANASPSADRASSATEGAASAAATPACDVAACERAYFTFRASDCTYQPYDGPRRLCTKGTPPQQKSASAEDARAQVTPSQACNVSACEAAYRSFDPSDCTYQPYDGPRRLCTK